MRLTCSATRSTSLSLTDLTVTPSPRLADSVAHAVRARLNVAKRDPEIEALVA
jgi:hypothetical protein